MYDEDVEKKLRSGGQLVLWGIVVLVVALAGTCAAVVSGANSANPAARGVEIGQSPWLLLSLAAATALIVLGLVRKANARNTGRARYLEHHTTVDVVPDADAAGGPFRGAMKEVEVLAPAVAAAEQNERDRDRRRGAIYLGFGGAIITLTIVGMLAASSGGDSPRRAAERVFLAMGIALFPFGLGLFLAIKGLLLRS